MNFSNRYLFSLIFERGLFFILGSVKIAIIILRLDPQAYVSYVSLLGITTLIATISRLGIEIYIKMEIPQYIGNLSKNKVIQQLIRLCLIPITSVIFIGLIFSIVITFLGYFQTLSLLSIFLIVILLSFSGLLYEIQISIEETKMLFTAQIVSSLSSIIIYYIWLPQGSSLQFFISIFIIINTITVIIYILSSYFSLELNSQEIQNDTLPEFQWGEIITKIGFSFLLLSTTLMTRLLPVSIIQIIQHSMIASIALTITLIDIVYVFFKQGTNFILLTSTSNKSTVTIPQYVITLFLSTSIIGGMFGVLILRYQPLKLFISNLIPGYDTSLPLAMVLLGYPKVVLLLSSSINEGYLIKFGNIKILSYTRVLSSIITISIIICFIFEVIMLSPLFIIIILVISEVAISLFSTYILRDVLSSIENIKYYVGQLIPLFLFVVIVYSNKINII